VPDGRASGEALTPLGCGSAALRPLTSSPSCEQTRGHQPDRTWLGTRPHPSHSLPPCVAIPSNITITPESTDNRTQQPPSGVATIRATAKPSRISRPIHPFQITRHPGIVPTSRNHVVGRSEPLLLACLARRSARLTVAGNRLQEKCQPRHHPGDDEGRCVPWTIPTWIGSDSLLTRRQARWRRPTTETTRSRRGMRREPRAVEKVMTDNNNRRFKTMEAAALRLQKESKGYLDSLRGASPCRVGL
jgi:hypothetical protein